MIDHSVLLNLNVDDHLQYLHIDGRRAMTGNLDMGGSAITNVGLVDGIDVTTHGSRHLSNGADPIAGATPSVGGLMSAADKQLSNLFADTTMFGRTTSGGGLSPGAGLNLNFGSGTGVVDNVSDDPVFVSWSSGCLFIFTSL